MLLSSTHYNTAPPTSTSLPSRGFSPCSYLGCFSGGRGTPGPPSIFLHLQPLVATSATAAATAVGGQRLNWPGSQQVNEGEQRLNWPGSLQVVELLFTSPWWSSSLLSGGAVFIPEELHPDAPFRLRTFAIIPCQGRRSAVPAPPPPSVLVFMSSGSAAGEVAVGVSFYPVSVYMCRQVYRRYAATSDLPPPRRHLGYTHTHRCIRLILAV
jgi:hypothetical protein